MMKETHNRREGKPMGNYVLENEKIRAEIRAKSAELRSLKRKDTEREYMWSADSQFWGWSSPILFPAVGKFHNDTYTLNGKTYTMEKHGFARRREFKVEFYTKDELWMSIEEDQETLAIYPYHFKLEVGYQLRENTLNVCWRVTNKDKKEMYFAIGGHPAFACPGSKTDYYLGIQGKDTSYNVMRVDMKKGFISPELHEFKVKNELHPVTKGIFDDDAIIFADSQVKTAYLAGADKKPLIKMHTNTPLLAFWSPSDEAPFICFEPWYGTGDLCDFEGSLKEKKWEQILEKNGVFEDSYSIEIVMD